VTIASDAALGAGPDGAAVSGALRTVTGGDDELAAATSATRSSDSAARRGRGTTTS